MFGKPAKFIAFLFLFISFLIINSNAQETIATEKRALIKKLLEVTETEKVAESITNSMLLQMEQGYPQMVSGMMNESGISKEEDREKFKKEIIESQQRFSKRFRELYFERVNLGEIIEEIYYPLYDKYFTESELKDLITFYETPSGKKWIKIMPEFTQESMQRSSEMLNPKIIQLLNEILQEERERLLKIRDSKQEEKIGETKAEQTQP